MAGPIASTSLWNVYRLPNGRTVNILRPELSVALAANRFHHRVPISPQPSSALSETMPDLPHPRTERAQLRDDDANSPAA